MTIIAKNGFSLASGIGFLSFMTAFWYGSVLGTPLKNLWHFSNIAHPQLERKSHLTTFDANDPNIDPMLARDFVLYVTQNTFDANPSTSAMNHKISQGWMTFSARSVVNQVFWAKPKISKFCYVAQAAEPTTRNSSPIINVNVQGYFHDHEHNAKVLYPLNMTFEVIKAKTGLRLNKISFSDETVGTLNKLSN